MFSTSITLGNVNFNSVKRKTTCQTFAETPERGGGVSRRRWRSEEELKRRRRRENKWGNNR